MKYFIISVDTEGDNLWSNSGSHVTTKNAFFIPRFQALCEEYGVKPVYLTNYEMANCDYFITCAERWLKNNSCEIGIHIHAWNNPPIYDLSGPFNGNPYLIEYPDSVMYDKFSVTYNLIKKNFGINPISHRAGRWAMDSRYFKLLKDFGILVDCSFTPGINWSNNMGITRGGSNYTKAHHFVELIDGVLEVPATLRRVHSIQTDSLKHLVKSLIIGNQVWLRPAVSSLSDMLRLMTMVDQESSVDFLHFMIHSSELMPNGSPYFKTEFDIEEEYHTIETIFRCAKENGYNGCSLSEYYSMKNQ